MIKKEIAIGVDIGGTNTVIGIVDKDGECLTKSHFSTADYPDATDYVNELCRQMTNLFSSFANEYIIKGIGIGAPNGNFYRGTVEFAPNLKWKGIVPLTKMITERMNVFSVLTNDANAAAVGEMIYGGAKGMKDFIEITIGTGLGSGIVSNGNVVYGKNGFAGELGHTTAVRDGRICTCGKRGCLETYVSTRGMIQTFNELSEVKSSIPLKDITPITITDLATKGNTIALQTFEETGKILGQSLADAACYTEPEAIFIFGGIAQAGNLLLEPIKRHMELNLLHIYKDKIKILPSSLPGDNAAILGASAMVWNKI